MWESPWKRTSGYYLWLEQNNNFVVRLLETTRITGYHSDPFIWTVYESARKSNPEVLNPCAVDNLRVTGRINPDVHIGGIQLKCVKEGWSFNNNMIGVAKGEDADGDYDREDRIEKILPLLIQQLQTKHGV